MSDSHPPIQLTDEHDQVLRGGTMDEAQRDGLWHRAARVVVTDSKGNMLLQKVPENPYYDGGKWNTSASGHVDEGEEYVDAAHREAEEELGVSLRKADFIEVVYYPSEHQIGERVFRRFNTTYEVTIDRDTFSPNPPSDEVEELRWFSPEEVRMLLLDHPQFSTDGLKKYFDEKNNERSK